MRLPLVFAFILTSVAVTAALLTPDAAGACSPCLPHERGEKWHLEVESWSVDGEPIAFTSTDGGLFVSNPIRRHRWGDWDASIPDVYLEASVVDPRSPGGARVLHLEEVNP